MTLKRSILFASALGLAVSGAFASESMGDAAGEPLGYAAIESSNYSYAEERGVAESAIPPSVDESGTVRSPTSLDEDYDVADVYDEDLSAPAALAPGGLIDPDLQEHSLASLDQSFDRFDANNDEMIGPQEAKADANLDRWFEWADQNQTNYLDRSEFEDAVVASTRMSAPPSS